MDWEEFLYVKEKLELKQVLDLIASYTISQEAKDKVLDSRPLNSIQDIEFSQAEISEAVELLQGGESFPIDGWRGSLKVLAKVRAEGILLDGEELYLVGRAEETAGDVKKFLSRRQDKFPHLADYADRFELRRDIVDSIKMAIDDTGRLKDSATQKLARLRREIISLRNELREDFNRFITRSGKKRNLEFVTLRGERYVVSVPRDEASRIKGVIHQASASGASLYIEPLEFVEKNNRLEELIGEEAREVNTILRELSRLVYNNRVTLIANQKSLVELDTIIAKARFAVEYGCTRPAHDEKGRFKLRGARHPLLEKKLKADGIEHGVVPLDIDCGSEIRVVVISGPNAGGKTVALKTIGLVVMMDRLGLLIPCKEDTNIHNFSDVLIDIGDDQSIERSLSTFSARVERLKKIMSGLTRRSLVLIDEIGDGTDPLEGSALAESLLEYIGPRASRTFVTTHLTSLKGWAHRAEFAVNATLEFDPQSMKPLYRFKLGVPGRSWGIDTAMRLGLDGGIVEGARKRLHGDQLRLEDLLLDLERMEKMLEKEYEILKKKERELSELVLNYRNRIDEFREMRDTFIEDARREAMQIVSDTRKQMENLIKEIRSTRAESSTIKKARRSIESLDVRLRRELERKRTKKDALQLKDLKEGMYVQVISLGKIGRVIKVDERGRVFVELKGGLRVETSVDDLVVADHEDKEKNISSMHTFSYEIEGEIRDTISVRGMERADALEVVDRFIDRAILAGLHRVTIIHGKGKGILRRAIYDMLKSDPRVKDVYPGEPALGGDGFAIVELK